GYIFQVDLAFRAVKDGFDVREVPITFTEREYGESKLDGSFVKDSLFEVTKWRVEHRSEQAKDAVEDITPVVARLVEDTVVTTVAPKLGAAATSVGDLTEELWKVAKFAVQDEISDAKR